MRVNRGVLTPRILFDADEWILMTQNRVFISYCHWGRGTEWKNALLRELDVFEQHHLIDVWQDGRIRIGASWNDDINRAMEEAHLAILLLTGEALESKYIREVELPFLKERQKRDNLPVFPVICEPCEWRAYDWLIDTQVSNQSIPVSNLSPISQIQFFRELARNIAAELSRLSLGKWLSSTPKAHGNRLSGELERKTFLEKFSMEDNPEGYERELIGREQELVLLDLALVQPNCAVVSLVAWGGVGKTMLVQNWIHRLRNQRKFQARIYAWSFYSQGTNEDRQVSEDPFIAHALEWFGVKLDPLVSPWDKGRFLAEAILREPTLVILDGIEPLQAPPGPMGGRLRAAGIETLLTHLARNTNSNKSRCLCLVTTRQPLVDLAVFEKQGDGNWGRVLRMNLGNLTVEAGATLLYQAGANRAGIAEISSADNELLAASREVNGHALTLYLLGRMLARAYEGDIRCRDFVKFKEADFREQGGTTFNLLAAFERWFANGGDFEQRCLTILRLLGLFDEPAEDRCLAELRGLPIITGLTDPLFSAKRDEITKEMYWQPLLNEDWHSAVSYLTDFGLVNFHVNEETRERHLNCHALIREYFSSRIRKLNEIAWNLAQARLFHFLQKKTHYRPSTIRDLLPLYQAAIHGCKAGFYDEAFRDVYLDRIERGSEYFSTRILGLYGSDIALLARFFDHSWTTPIADLSEHLLPELLGTTGFFLHVVGRPDEALAPMMAAVDLTTSKGDWLDAAICTHNLSELEVTLGRLDDAVVHGQQSIDFADKSSQPYYAILTRSCTADALFERGRRSEAIQLFRTAEQLQGGLTPNKPLLTTVSGVRFCSFMLARAEEAAWRIMLGLKSTKHFGQQSVEIQNCIEVERRALAMLVEHSAADPSVNVARYHLLLGKAVLYKCLLQSGDLTLSENYFTKAASHSLRAGYSARTSNDCLNQAWLRKVQGMSGAAQADLDEAWDIASRGPMRLLLADIHLHRARLFFRDDVYPWKSPQDDLMSAEELVRSCKYHRRDAEILDAKRVILV